jgi:hypothetical protein
LFYILKKTTYSQFIRRVGASAYIDLPNDEILAKVAFTHEGARNEFENHNEVTSLPHPMSTETVGKDVAAKLVHMGVAESHRTFDVARLASKIHPMMKIR